MPIFDKLASAAKDFFIEPEEGASNSTPSTAPPTVQFGAASPSAASPDPTPTVAAPAVTQAEQRHLDHIAGLLAGDGKDFAAYVKMVKSMAAAGLSGPMLYQTAFNAFAAVNGSTVPALLASATQYEQTLTDDREKVLARHREKMGEAATGAAPGPVALLVTQEKKLTADLAELTRQVQAKQQQLAQTQQQLGEERRKTQSALASYELANSAALADLQHHRKAAETFLNAAK